jgi:orotate phosphoribosyltransferase
MRTSVASQLLKAGILRREKVQLKSGFASDVYVDVKSTYGNPKLLRFLAKAIADLLPANTSCIATGGYGGLPLGTAVSLVARVPLAMVREKPKSHGRSVWIDGFLPTSHDRVVLIDDVYTSGGSLRHIERVIRTTRARIIGRCVIVDRSKNPTASVRSLVRIKGLLDGE